MVNLTKSIKRILLILQNSQLIEFPNHQTNLNWVNYWHMTLFRVQCKVLNTWQPIRFVCLFVYAKGFYTSICIQPITWQILVHPSNSMSIPRTYQTGWNGNATGWKAINQIVHLCGFMCVLYTNLNFEFQYTIHKYV